MLNKIFIKNYILIDELQLDLSNGLNIITGETGAGKSILINAIDIAFGAKAGKEVVKNGSDKAVIELTLTNTKHDLTDFFEQNGIDNMGEEIILSKEISLTGSRTRVNGSLVNQDFMKNFREYFIDINSQHQTYSFLQPKYHITLLDSYIKSNDLNTYKTLFKEYKNKLAQLEELKLASQKTEDQIEFLRFQVNEIEDAKLDSITEDEDLNNELSVLENVEKLKELTGSSYWALTGDDNSILEALFQIKSSIAKSVSLDNSLESTESELLGAIETLKEIASSLRDYSSSLENDTERINEIQERIFLLDKLKRKYGGSLEKVIQTGSELREQLDNFDFSTEKIEALEQECEIKKQELLAVAKKISNERKNYATVLSSLIVEKLEKLELHKSRFEISVEETELTTSGIDKVEFFSP